MSCNLHNAICVPSLFDWKDKRIDDIGTVKDKQTKRTYGSATKDPNWQLRFKFTELTIFQLPVSLCLRIPCRIITLISGDFVWEGLYLAEKEWQLERQQWSLSDSEKPAPSERDLCTKKAYYISLQFIKNIAKIVSYPLAMIALEFASLYGLFIHPLDGRKLFSTIEEFWSRYTFSDSDIPFFGDFIAPCMQPKDVWENRNLYGNDLDSPQSDFYCAAQRVSRLMRDRETFFKNEKVFDCVQESLAKAHKIYRIGFNVDGAALGKQLLKIHDILKDIEKERDCMVLAKINMPKMEVSERGMIAMKDKLALEKKKIASILVEIEAKNAERVKKTEIEKSEDKTISEK